MKNEWNISLLIINSISLTYIMRKNVSRSVPIKIKFITVNILKWEKPDTK